MPTVACSAFSEIHIEKRVNTIYDAAVRTLRERWDGTEGRGGLDWGPDSPCSLESSHPEDVNEWMDSLPASYLHTPRLATTYENSYHCPRGPGTCQASWYRGGRQDMSRGVGRTVLNGSMTCETTRWEKKGRKQTCAYICIYDHRKSTISSGMSFICTCPLSASFIIRSRSFDPEKGYHGMPEINNA